MMSSRQLVQRFPFRRERRGGGAQFLPNFAHDGLRPALSELDAAAPWAAVVFLLDGVIGIPYQDAARVPE